jgi:AcrR family transcriptional regulator
MARQKDADKRQLIMGESKRMFADKGYDGTSMGGLARRIGIPVGSLYTYFDSKEVLLNTIIEEGWDDFAHYLEAGLADQEAAGTVPGVPPDAALLKLAFLVRGALPQLFEDLDLIAILLAQADRTSHLKEKLEYLASLIASIIMDYRDEGGNIVFMGIPTLKAGLAIMLLGSLESMRLIHRAGIDIEAVDVIAFLVSTVEGALGCSLPGVGAVEG